MSASRDAHNGVASNPAADPNHGTYGVPTTEPDEDARRVSLLGNPDDQHDPPPGPAPSSTPKTNAEAGVEEVKPADRKAGRSCTWFSGDGWTLELLAAICSIACFVAIVAVLEAYDGRESPSLSFGITLNAIISILSTTAKSSIMYGIGAAIGQAKWDWFNDEARYHNLRDLEHIDEASRGPLGSFRMFFTPTRWSIASVGAIVTLLMLAVDPFVQQILIYQQEPNAVASPSAWTEQVLAPTIFSNNSDPLYFGAINSALWSDDVSYKREAHCPTGNCTYPPFQSMGLCVTTQEVPLDQISFGGMACNTTYADTATGKVVFGNLTYTLTTALDYIGRPTLCSAYFWGDNTTYLELDIPWDSEWSMPLDSTGPMEIELGGEQAILGIRSPLLALGRISMSSPTLVGNESMSLQFDRAEQVVISFCGGDYNTTVSQGTTSTSVGNMSSPTGFSYSDSTTVLGENATCWTSGSEQSSFPDAEIKQGIHGRYIASTSPLSFCTDNWGWGDDISSRLTGNSYFGVQYKSTHQAPGTRQPSNDSLWYLTNSTGINNEDVQQQIQSRSLHNITTSITASLNALFRKYSSDRATGSYIEYQTVVRVQWPWLTLPVVVEILGFVFLLLIALRSQGSRNPWKGSILAALFHGLNPNSHKSENLNTITSMEREATKTMVKLDTSDSGKRFLRRRSNDPS